MTRGASFRYNRGRMYVRRRYDVNGRLVRVGGVRVPKRPAMTAASPTSPLPLSSSRSRHASSSHLARQALTASLPRQQRPQSQARRLCAAAIIALRSCQRLLGRFYHWLLKKLCAMRKLSRLRLSWRLASQVGAGLLAAAAVYAVVDTILLNQKIKHNQAETVAAVQSDDAESRQAAEGKEEKPVEVDVVAGYKVAPELPRVISIDKIGVRARALPMGVNRDGSMQAPINVFDAGWYTGSVKPGHKGAMAIVGHVSGPSQNGLFKNLHALKAGDIVSIENGAGTTFKYQVVTYETVKLEQVDMDKFLKPARGVAEGLNLMTCAGKWLKGSATFDSRTIVYTKRIQ